ncbi:MAG: BspA family leucine-rich repeat surface protein [Adlercreutzia sp.]|nr:BspA family leucine-rich repeat surface protein [Adlercreutzia sp.]
MENTTTTQEHRALKLALALLLCIACIPAQSLAFARQAWAESTDEIIGYAVFYAVRPNSTSGLTLVFQKDDQIDRKYGYASTIEPVALHANHNPYANGSYHEEFYKSGTTEVQRIIVRDRLVMPARGFKFIAFRACTSMDLRNFDTSQVTNMSSMFSGCRLLETLDISTFDTSNVEYMDSMFSGCDMLKSINLSSFNTAKVKSMSSMFEGCWSLKTLDLSKFNTGRVYNMNSMFEGCWSLKTLDLSSFDTYWVQGMSSMFSGCTFLESVDVSSFDTTGVDSMSCMFDGCQWLKELDLSNFETPICENMSFMFNGCSSLTKLDISNLDITHCTDTTILHGCNSLKEVKLPNKRTSDFLCFISGWPSPSYIPNATGKIIGNKGQILNGTYEIQDGQGGWYRAQIQSVQEPAPVTWRPSISFASVKVGSRVFSGKTQTPSSVKVTRLGKTLKKGTDYTVSCKGGKKVGSYKVTIKGKGAYTGTKAATFKILPKGTSISKLVKAKRGFTVKWKKPSKTARSQIDGYQVRYSTKKSMKGAKKVTVKDAKKTSAKVSKLKGGKKYYVQVRSYKKVGGKTYYSSWSKAKTVKTKK